MDLDGQISPWLQAPYHYLVDEVDMYDISYLFKRLVDVLEQITICSLDDELEAIIKMDYKPAKQNIFSYVGDLKKAIKRLNDINERLPEKGRIMLPDSYLRSRLVRAARQVPVYKPVLDRLLIMHINEWAKITSDDLYHQLEAVCANDQSVGQQTYTPSNYDTLTANSMQFKEKNKRPNTNKIPCRNFAIGVPCTNNPCTYSHSKGPVPGNKKGEQKNQRNNARPAPPTGPPRCTRCDAPDHSYRECQYSGKCPVCERMGHKEKYCWKKKANANFAEADGYDVFANMISVQEKLPLKKSISNSANSVITLPPARYKRNFSR